MISKALSGSGSDVLILKGVGKRVLGLGKSLAWALEGSQGEEGQSVSSQPGSWSLDSH